MKSVRLAGAIIAAALVAPLFPSPAANADPIDDQRARVEQITDQLAGLERQADILNEDYSVATDELRQLDAEVAAAEDAVTEQQAEVEELQGALSDVAVQAFMGAGGGGLGPLFADSTSINAELQRDELTRAALNTGTASSDDLDRELNELDDAQELLEDQRGAAEDKKDDVEAAREATEERSAEYQQARIEAEAELGNLIQEEEERRARESYERMQAEAEAAAAQAQADAAAAQTRAQQQAESAAPVSGSDSPAGGNNGGNGAAVDGGGGRAPASPAPAAPVNVPAASSRVGTAINAAMTQIGVPWVFAKAEPGVAFDCSGLTSWSWAQAGVSMPHQSRAQYATFPHVPSSAVQPGDLIFFYSPISHVGMYIGNGQMIHSPNSGSTVHVRTVNWSNVTGVARPG